MTAPRISMPDGKPEKGVVFFVYRAKVFTGSSMHTAVDEAGIVFKKDTSQGTLRRAVFIVLGNDGYDCICDHSLSNPEFPEDDFEKVMREEVDPLCDKLAEQYV